MLILSAFVLSFFGLIMYSPFEVFFSLVVVLIAGIITNYIFSKIIGARTNLESVLITLLILILIFPIKFPTDILFAMFAAVLAISSKYLLTIEKLHIFNPVAVSAVAMALLYPDRGATWWVGTPIMFPFVLAGGLLIIWRLRAWKIVITFLATYLAATALGTIFHGGSWPNVFAGWQIGLTYSALLFFTFIMLTEPLTSPLNRQKRLNFAILVALLYSTIQLKILGLSFTPEIALVFGNIYAYLVRPQKTMLTAVSDRIQPNFIQ